MGDKNSSGLGQGNIPWKLKSAIIFYVVLLKLWLKELQSIPKNILLNGLEIMKVKYNNLRTP